MYRNIFKYDFFFYIIIQHKKKDQRTNLNAEMQSISDWCLRFDVSGNHVNKNQYFFFSLTWSLVKITFDKISKNFSEMIQQKFVTG